jgi:hypothetical protein
LIENYPQSTLVQAAIDALVRMVRQSPEDEALVNRVVVALDKFQQTNPSHPLQLYAQTGIADITHYALRDRAQAKIDYAKILREAKDPDLIELLRNRLTEIDER